MKPVLAFGAAAALAGVLVSCGAGTGMPGASSPGSPAEPPTFTGTGVDANLNTGGAGGMGTTVVSWTVTQAGTSVSGTMKTQSTDSPGTCASCHRSRTGTLTGTITGTTLEWTASFPADPAADPTPVCTATLKGTIPDITANSVSGTYKGNDKCEGDYTDGTLTMARTAVSPPPGM